MDSLPHGLTQREKEVLRLIAAGLSTKEIAADLGITFKTAASHRANIMVKLGAHSVVDLVRYVLQGQQCSQESEREQLEHQYLEKVREAEKAYRLAAAHFTEMVEKARGASWKLDADGSQALHIAGIAEREAIEKYAEALKVFTDLVVRGRRPSQPGLSSNGAGRIP